MTTIILLGELGKRFGRRHKMAVASAAEAVRALCANFPTFERELVGLR
jgi:predicted phage tail protein